MTAIRLILIAVLMSTAIAARAEPVTPILARATSVMRSAHPSAPPSAQRWTPAQRRVDDERSR